MNLPVHFACFAEMIAGECTRAVLRGMRGKDFPEFDYRGTLRDGLMDAVLQIVGEALEE